jgi:pilus assembly protein Flp/PilA
MSTKHSSNQSWPHSILALVHRCLADEHGATAIEYALIACGVGAAIAATVFGFGSNLKTVFYDKIAALL